MSQGYKKTATDGIVIVVYSGNPLTNLSMDELKDVFDGTTKEWGELE